MGLFNKNEEQSIKRLSQNAGGIIEMLKAAFMTPNGVDIRMSLIYAAGLAGYACHQAVKAEHGSFVVATSKDGRNYYFGDDVNKYLVENKFSVLGSIAVVAEMSEDDVTSIVKEFAESIGGDNTICDFAPKDLYNRIKQCWDGIFENMTSRYCKSPSEWPILFSIVTQNILKKAIEIGAPKEQAGKIAAECAVALSKMDDDSI